MNSRSNPEAIRLVKQTMAYLQMGKDDLTLRPAFALASLMGLKETMKEPKNMISFLASLELGMALGLRFPEYAHLYLQLEPGRKDFDWMEACQDFVELVPLK